MDTLSFTLNFIEINPPLQLRSKNSTGSTFHPGSRRSNSSVSLRLALFVGVPKLSWDQSRWADDGAALAGGDHLQPSCSSSSSSRTPASDSLTGSYR